MNNKDLSKNKLAILILAGKVKLQNYNFQLHEYLFNIGNSLTFERILKKLDLNSNHNIYLVVPKLDDKFIKFVPFRCVNFIEVGETNSILESISVALKKLSEKKIKIIPITTIPDLSKIEEKTCYFGSKLIPKENWSAIEKISNLDFNFLHKADKNSYGTLSYPCTGRLVAEKLHLEESIALIEDQNKSDIIYLFEILIRKYKYKIIFEEWFDVGHEATYIDSRLSAITSRFFNNIYFQESTDSIIKYSEDTKKLGGEILYYQNLPKRLKKLFPYVFTEYKSDEDNKSIEMEFIPFPNLAEIFLFKRIGPNAWIRIISSITKVYNAFYKEEEYKIKSNASWLYSSKLFERFQQTKIYIEKSNNETLKILLNEGIIVNNKFQVESLFDLFDKLNYFLLKYESSIEQFLGHGDLCFNNILVDQLSGSVKLIDPKAYLNKKDHFLGLIDPNYDLAKINHSCKYLYDSVVNNLYYIQVNKNEVDISIYAPLEYDLVNKLFNQYLIKKNLDQNTLRFLTASLFMSMLPLHIDDENRMICFAILGSIAMHNFDFDKLIVQV